MTDAAAEAKHDESLSGGSRLWVLWFGLLIGPIAWALDLEISYSLVKWACAQHTAWVLHLVSLATIALVAAGGLGSWRSLQRLPAGASLSGGRSIDRGRFMAVGGMVMSAFFIVVTIANDIPRFVLDACQQ